MPNADAASVKNVHRLGIMGGSFDPIHMAHLVVAEASREALRLDKVLFVPTGRQPLKLNRPVTPAEHRVAMVELAIQGNPRFALSRVDVDRQGPSYTAETIKLLRDEWGGPNTLDMWLIMGADSLNTLPNWRDPAAIIAHCRLAVVRRPGSSVDIARIRTELPEIEDAADWIDAPLIDISATDLRRRVQEGRSIRYRVPDAVRKYIKANGLYK